jgi:hypothetical protein
MDLATFLGNKGAPEMLAALHVNEKARFTDLQEAVGIAPKTISKRINEAVECELVTTRREVEKREDSESGEPTRSGTDTFILTERGFAMTREMARRGLVRQAQQKRILEQELEDGVEQLRKDIKNEPELLTHSGIDEIPQERYRELRERKQARGDEDAAKVYDFTAGGEPPFGSDSKGDETDE